MESLRVGVALGFSIFALQPLQAVAETTPLNTAVIYELHVGSFNPNAMTPDGTLWGTFNSASQKIDYLSELGVTTIELLPVHESATPYDWGYDVSLPDTIEESYGSPDDLKNFVREAHRRGMGVLLDVVHNHYSTHSALDASYFYTHEHETPWGPRPNYGQAEVRQLIATNIDHYIDQFQVDGFRWDAAPYITHFYDYDAASQSISNDGINADGVSLLQQMNLKIHQQPGLVSIAEDFETDPSVTTAVVEGGLGFDAHWAGFSEVTQAITAAPEQIDLSAVKSALLAQSDRVIFTESHDEVGHPPDQVRIPSRIDPDHPGSLLARKRSLAGAALLMTTPGVPMLFQGQEMLEDQTFAFPLGTPLDWQKVSTYAGIFSAYQDLISLRKNTDSTTGALSGDAIRVYHQNDQAKVIAFERGDADGTQPLVVLANLGEESFTRYRIGLPSIGPWRVRFSTDDTKYSSDFGGTPSERNFLADSESYDQMPFSKEIELAPFTVMILEGS
jgi:1,4-alpha-glucan branching enzyme